MLVIAILANKWQPTAVDVAVMTRGTIHNYVEERAQTRLPQVYRISMPLPGRILPIEVRERDSVSAGQVVARMDPADLETDVAESTARVRRLEKMIVENQDNRLELNAILGFDEFLKSMEAAVESAKLQTTSSDERFKFAQQEYHRKIQLFEKEVLTESERNEAELFEIESRIDYQKDLLTLRSLQAVNSAMKIGRQSIEDYIDKKSLRRDVMHQEKLEAEAQAEQAQRDRERVEMRSPVDGTVLKRLISNDRVLPAGEILLEIGQLEQLEIEAEVLTQDVVEIKPGNAVDIHGPAIGATPVQGTVNRIYPQGFTKVSSLGVEQQRVLVIIDFVPGQLQSLRDSGRELGADFRVNVKIYTGQEADALLIPRPAIFRGSGGEWQTFVVREGRARLVTLKLGLINDFHAEVQEGVQEGESVLLAPEATIIDGANVEPRSQDSPAR